MGRNVHRLTALKIRTLTAPGRHADGGNLYLSISSNGGRRWVFLYRWNGRPREMGLGSAKSVTLARARELATTARQQVAEGVDPLSTRQLAQGVSTFKECATAFINAHAPGWKNAKHAGQWTTTLEHYAYPEIGLLPVDQVSIQHVTKILEPIWSSKTETASRVRGRLEAVLDWAKARGYRSGENPARWRGHLENLFPKRSKVQKVAHHAALPYTEIGSFMSELQKRQGLSSLALEFLILTAARTNEVIGAPWKEIDFAAKAWVIPAKRMKGDKEHRVPLTVHAMAIVNKLHKGWSGDPNDLIFPSNEPKQALSNNAMLKLLERMDRDDVTVHGFRSTFRDWAAECTNFPNHVVEMALAHSIKDKAEAAYRRGALLEKRRALMEAWAAYCYKITDSPTHRRPKAAAKTEADTL